MRVMALGAFKIGSLKRGLGRPLPAPISVGAALPVLIDQTMAAGAQFFYIDMHDPGAVIVRIFIAILNEMTVLAAVIGPVI